MNAQQVARKLLKDTEQQILPHRRKRLLLPLSMLGVAVVTTAIVLPISLIEHDRLPDFKILNLDKITKDDNYDPIDIQCETNLSQTDLSKYKISWSLDVQSNQQEQTYKDYFVQDQDKSSGKFTVTDGLNASVYNLDFICTISNEKKVKTVHQSSQIDITLGKHYTMNGSNWEGWISGTVECKPNNEVPGTVTVSNGNDRSGGSNYKSDGLTIPRRVWDDTGNSYKVTCIGDYAFNSGSGNPFYLNGPLTIPTSVTIISSYAFDYCKGLTGHLVIPNSVVSIGAYVFSSCSGFDTLTISCNLKTIDERVFNYCEGFTGPLIIPNGAVNINNGAFNGCTGFTSIILSDTVESVGNGAFYYCRNLTGPLFIPKNVETVGDTAFDCAPKLDGPLTISSKVRSLGFYFCGEAENISRIDFYPEIECSILYRAFGGIGDAVPSTTPKIIRTVKGSHWKIEDFKGIGEGWKVEDSLIV